MVHEGALVPVSTVDDDELPVPPLMEDDFENVLSLGISFTMWSVMTAEERMVVGDFLDLDSYERKTIEEHTCRSRKGAVSRRKYEKAISKAMAIVHDPKSKGSEYRKTEKATSSYHAPMAVTTREFLNHVGIQNQGATCYLSSLIQSLFHVPAFRRAIFSMTVPAGTQPSDYTPLALQELFLNLQEKKRDCMSRNLTKSFGWDAAATAIQHDCHELLTKLLDALENHFDSAAKNAGAGEDYVNPIKQLFLGKRRVFTKCLDVDYTSTREETMYYAELVVKGNESIEGSLKAETTPERLEGSNKYLWEHEDEPVDPETGKVRKTYHEADRGTAYADLPKLLFVHPNRADFCMTTFQRITVPGKWSFGTELDMAPYVETAPGAPAKHFAASQAEKAKTEEGDADAMDDDDDKVPVQKQATEPPLSSTDEAKKEDEGGEDTVKDATGDPKKDEDGAEEPKAEEAQEKKSGCTYRLNSVVIHSGAAQFGHYYCYVNINDAWLKFNDTAVSDVHINEVFNDAFSGAKTDRWGYSTGSSTRTTLLVYIRDDVRDEILAPVKPEEVPTHLHALQEEETRRKEAERERVEQESKLSPVPIIRVAADGSHIKQLRELRSVTATKLDPELPFVRADPQLENCTLFKVDNYFNWSAYYRNATYHAKRVPAEALVGDHWSLPRYAGATATHALIAVPFDVCPPPAEGDDATLITALRFDSAQRQNVYAGTFTSKRAFQELFFPESLVPPSVAEDAEQPPIESESDKAPPLPVKSEGASGAPSPMPGNPVMSQDEAYEALMKERGDKGKPETDASDASVGAHASPRDNTPTFELDDGQQSPDGDRPVTNPLDPLSAPTASTLKDDENIPVITTTGPSTGGAATTTTTTTTAGNKGATGKDAQEEKKLCGVRVMYEASLKLEEVPLETVVSGDVVTFSLPGDATLLDARRAHNLEHFSCDVTLFRLPDSFSDGRVESTVAPVGGNSPAGVSPETPSGEAGDELQKFPTSDQAMEMGQLRVCESDTFDELQKAVHEYLSDPNIDPRCIAFRGHSATADAPHKSMATRFHPVYSTDPVPRPKTVKDILSGSSTYMIMKLYFEVLPMPVADFESQGLRDYVAVDGGVRRHFWAPKLTTYVYAEDAKKLRSEACKKLDVPMGRVAVVGNDYYGLAESYFVDLFPRAPVTATTASGSVKSTTQSFVDELDGDTVTDADKPAPTTSSTPPPAPQDLREDIVVPYPTPTYSTLDQSHLVVLPQLPPKTVGSLPAKPDVATPGIEAKADPADAAPEREMRWMLIGLQHSTRRSRDDIFGFGTCIFLCESDTGEMVRRRVLEHLGVTEDDEQAKKWNLLYMKSSSSSPMLVAKDTRAYDMLPWDGNKPATTTTTSTYSSVYGGSSYNYGSYAPRFSGSLVIERPFPDGAGPKKKKSGARYGSSPEPELRIHSKPNPDAGTPTTAQP